MTTNSTTRGKSMMVNPATLIPYERNSRIHNDAQITMIAESIATFGFLKPVLIDDKKMLLAGHGATLAAIQLDMSQIPARQITGLTDDQKRAFVIADNRSSELSKWDWGMLSLELSELQSVEMDLKPLGFPDFGKDASTHRREGHNVTLGDGRFLLQLEFESEADMQKVYEEMHERGITLKVLE